VGATSIPSLCLLDRYWSGYVCCIQANSCQRDDSGICLLALGKKKAATKRKRTTASVCKIRLVTLLTKQRHWRLTTNYASV
jgi:hypothetical protein